MTNTGTNTSATVDNGLARTALVLGLIAALLTTTLAFISLGVGAIAVVLGANAVRRGQPVLPAALGMTLAATSLYIIVLEILVLGG